MTKKSTSLTRTSERLSNLGKQLAESVRAGEAAKGKRIHKIDLKVHKGPMMVPEGMSLKQVDNALHDLMAFQEAEVQISEAIKGAFVWDGARAFTLAMAEMFGWAEGVPTPGFFGDTPPKMISVEVALGETEMVQWGEIKVPGVEGKLQAASGIHDNRIVFVAGALVKRKYEPIVRALIERTKEILVEDSIYRGQAVRISFSDPGTGQKLAIPTASFLDLSKVNPEKLVYSEDVRIAIEDSLFTPIEQPLRVMHECGGWKRGVLLAGKFGTGKTLGAMVAATKAVQSGLTFVYLDNPNDVQDGMRFALQYADPGAVIFLEDVDRVVTGDRSLDVDRILNIVDGFESKGKPIMTVLTTNNVEQIQQAALRPGRLDAIIEVKPPDALAVQKLIRLAAGDSIEVGEDLSEVGQILNGNIPAVIEEVVKRAKLGAITRTKMESVDLLGERHVVEHRTPFKLMQSDLLRSARSMKLQLDLLNRETKTAPDPLVLLGRSLAQIVVNTEEFKQVQRITAANAEEQPAKTIG